MEKLSPNNLTELKNRKESIYGLLLADNVNLQALKVISRGVGGFLSNDIRSRVWPKLLGINRFIIPDYEMDIVAHKDDGQVHLDVERSLWSHEHTIGWSEAFRTKRRRALKDIIMAVLCRNPELHYYQGYHDVVSIFLLVVDEDHLAFALTEVVSNRYLMDFLAKDFEVLCRSMRMILTIISIADVAVGHHLSEASVEPFFATSWLITWFAHDVKKINDIARIYDAMLCSHPLFAFYLCAAMVISIRENVLDCECDFASLFDLLAHAPQKIGTPCETLIALADKLMILIPPGKLKKCSDHEVRRLIDRDLVQFFRIPVHLVSCSVPADWVLLQLLYVSPNPDNLLLPNLRGSASAKNKGEGPACSPISFKHIFQHSFHHIQNSQIVKKFRKKENSLEKKYSYVGPFSGRMTPTEALGVWAVGDTSGKWEDITSNVVDVLHHIDGNTHSLQTLFFATTFLSGMLGGTLLLFRSSPSAVYCDNS